MPHASLETLNSVLVLIVSGFAVELTLSLRGDIEVELLSKDGIIKTLGTLTNEPVGFLIRLSL